MFKHAAVSFLVAAIATFAVVAFFSTGSQNLGLVENQNQVDLQMANRDKTNLAPMEGVEEAAADILAEDSKTRGYVITFNPARDKMVAAVRIPKSDDWKTDWEDLQAALPENDVAAAIYSFPFWAGPAAETSKPVLFTSRPNVDYKDEYLAGYWLGPLIIASEGVHKVKSYTGENYFEMCSKLGIEEQLCQLENQFHECPFAGDDSEVNPCTEKDENGRAVCGGSYVEEEVDTGSISKACCLSIDKYCGEDQERVGCRGATLEMIMANCNAPMPEIEVTPLMEFYEKQACDAICGTRSCIEFEDARDTYKQCAGCNGSFKEYPCSPSQPGFMAMRCAGPEDVCGDAMSEFDCGVLGDVCLWASHDMAADFETVEETAVEGE